eukprot:363650-Chlamydomonas_euryale.AAC.5
MVSTDERACDRRPGGTACQFTGARGAPPPPRPPPPSARAPDGCAGHVGDVERGIAADARPLGGGENAAPAACA